MQSVSDSLLQELQRQRETQAEDESSRRGEAQEGGRRVPSTKASSTSILLSRRSSASSTSSPFFLETPAREPPRQSPSEQLGERRLSRNELSLSHGAPVERPEPRPGSTTSPSWSRTSEEISSQLLGRRTGTDADLCRVASDSIQQYSSDMRSLLAKTTLTIPHALPPDLTIAPTPSSSHSHHSAYSISSITSNESYASSFAYGVRRSKPDLRLLRKGSKPSQHLKPKPSLLKPATDGRRSPSFYQPRVVEDTGVIVSTSKPLTPLPHTVMPVSLTLSELLNSDAMVKPVQRVNTSGSDTIQSRRKGHASALKPAISNLALSRPILSQQFVDSTGPIELPHRPPAKASRQLRFDETLHMMYSGRSSPRGFAVNSHLNQADPATGFRKNSHITARAHKKHNPDVTPPDNEADASGDTLFQYGDSYFHTFDDNLKYNKELVPVPTRASGRFRSVVQAISAATSRRSEQVGETIAKAAVVVPLASTSKKRPSSALFGLYRKSTVKVDVKDETLRGNRTARRSRSKGRRFGTPETSPRPTPLPMPETPIITLDTPTLLDSDGDRKGSIVPELRIPSYCSRPRMRRFDSEWSSCPSPGHASPGSSEAISESGSTSRYPQRSRRQRRSSSEALSPMSLAPMGMTRRPPVIQPRSPHTDYGEAKVTEGHVSPDLRPSPGVEAASGAGHESPVCNTQKPAKALASTSVVEAGAVPTKASLDQTGVHSTRILRRKPSVWKGVKHGLRKMSSLRGFREEEAVSNDWKTSANKQSSVMPRISLPSISLRASRSSINVRNGRLVRKVSRSSQLQRA